MEIVPVAELPPVTLLTCQVTDWFVEPATVAENWSVEPSRVELAPVTATEMTGGGGELELPEEHPTRAARDKRAKGRTRGEGRTFIRTCSL
jgi:hypothetical protein